MGKNPPIFVQTTDSLDVIARRSLNVSCVNKSPTKHLRGLFCSLKLIPLYVDEYSIHNAF